MSLLQRLPTGAFARQVAMLTTGTAVGQLVLVAVMPLLTRLFTPADLGVFGLFSSFLAVAGVATCLRLEWGVASAHSAEEAAGLLVLCLVLCPVTSLLLAAGLAGLIGENVVSFGLLPMWTVPLGFLALVATGAFAALRYWHIGRRDFRDVSAAAVAQGVGRAGTSVALGLAGTGWAGLLLGDLVGRVLGIGRLWRRALPGLQEQFHGDVRRVLSMRLVRMALSAGRAAVEPARCTRGCAATARDCDAVRPGGRWPVRARLARRVRPGQPDRCQRRGRLPRARRDRPRPGRRCGASPAAQDRLASRIAGHGDLRAGLCRGAVPVPVGIRPRVAGVRMADAAAVADVVGRCGRESGESAAGGHGAPGR